MPRNQFTFYKSFYESIEKLQTNKEKLQAYQILCRYALDKTEPDLNSVKPCAAMVFNLVKPVLDTAHRRSRCATALNERKQSVHSTINT